MTFDVVIPSAGRASLAALLEALAGGDGPLPGRVIVVDDRPARAADGLSPAVEASAAGALGDRLAVLRGRGAGPAAARNAGWRAAAAEWVAFLDDDVVPAQDWRKRLAADLAGLALDVAGVQGRVEVPLPSGRRPTDWERNVRGLESALWATADMAYRRRALIAAHGFDERFRRAYREDADLGLRMTAAGWRIVRGERRVSHPVRRAGTGASLKAQAGNADDVQMRALHGRGWRERAGAPAGRRNRHLAVTAAGAGALAALALGRTRTATVAAAAWATGTAELAWARIAPGPRTAGEVMLMIATGPVLPPVATLQTVRGIMQLPALKREAGPGPAAPPPAAEPQAERLPAPVNGASASGAPRERPDAVLLDRDGTLVLDVPYNDDPGRVEPVPGARQALERLRGAGVRLAVVSNQSGIGRGLLDERRVEAVNRRVEELLGPLGPWLICPHHPAAGCHCRKPQPGLVLRAAELLGVAPGRCAVVGDIGADVEAARAAGARAVLVPNERTRPAEVAGAPETAATLGAAVDLLIGEGR